MHRMRREQDEDQPSRAGSPSERSPELSDRNRMLQQRNNSPIHLRRNSYEQEDGQLSRPVCWWIRARQRRSGAAMDTYALHEIWQEGHCLEASFLKSSTPQGTPKTFNLAETSREMITRLWWPLL
ncbi:unnamed protein product [Caenorhabditis brenneri]